MKKSVVRYFAGVIAIAGALVANARAGDIREGSDLGLGRYQRNPWNVTLDIRTGYDTNSLTTHDSEQGSWFTNVMLDVARSFGGPRTRLSLDVAVGGTYFWDRDDNWD